MHLCMHACLFQLLVFCFVSFLEYCLTASAATADPPISVSQAVRVREWEGSMGGALLRLPVGSISILHCPRKNCPGFSYPQRISRCGVRAGLAAFECWSTSFQEALKVVQPSAKREGFATVPDVTWEDVGALEAIREELSYAILVCCHRQELFAASSAV